MTRVCWNNMGDRSAHLGFIRSTNAFFFSRRQPLDLLFASNCIAGTIETLVVNESAYFVIFSEPVDFAVLMLPDSSHQTVRDAGVENDSATVSHQIDIKCFHQSVLSCFTNSVIPSAARDLSFARNFQA